MRHNWRWTIRKISRAIGIVNSLIIVAGMMAIVGLAYIGTLEESFVTALATTILAVLTYLNVQSSNNAVQEMKKDREKPGIVRLIATEIDSRINSLENHSEKIGESTSPQKFPDNLYPIGRDHRIEDEIERDFPGYSDLLDNYNKHIEEYHPAVDELKTDIESHLKGEFFEQLSDEELAKIKEIVETRELETFVLELYEAEDPVEKAYFDKYSDVLSGMLIRLDLENLQPHFEDTWDAFGDGILNLRKTEFKDRFDRLDRLLQSIRETNDSMNYGLKRARRSFMDEYGIIESEVKQVKEESDDDTIEVY